MPYYATRLEASTGTDLKRIFGGQPAQSLIEYEDVDPQRSNDQNLWMSLGEGRESGRTFPRMI